MTIQITRVHDGLGGAFEIYFDGHRNTLLAEGQWASFGGNLKGTVELVVRGLNMALGESQPLVFEDPGVGQTLDITVAYERPAGPADSGTLVAKLGRPAREE